MSNYFSSLDVWKDVPAIMAEHHDSPVIAELRRITEAAERERDAVAAQSLAVRDAILNTAAGWTGK